MLLRPRQKQLVDKIIKVLEQRNKSFFIAPTGSGKTIMLSFILKHLLKRKIIKKALVVSQRNIINEQNEKKFKKINPDIDTCFFNSEIKRWDAQVIFGMIQTLHKEHNLANKNNIDMLIIDEAHHSTEKNTYQKVIKYFEEKNPNCKILGMTATPKRSDKERLNCSFDRIDDEITIEELLESGHLVKPICFSLDDIIKDKTFKNYNHRTHQASYF